MIRRPPRSTPFPTRRSSDLCAESGSGGRLSRCSGRAPPPGGGARPEHRDNLPPDPLSAQRSEERRVGKGVDLGGRRIIKKKKRKELGSPETLHFADYPRLHGLSE